MSIRGRAIPAFLLLLPLCGLAWAQDAGSVSALESLRLTAPDAAGIAASVPSFKAAPVEIQSNVSIESLSGAALLQALHEQTGRSYREHSYDEAQNYIFSAADNVLRGGERGVADAYSGVFVPGSGTEGGGYRENGDQNGDNFVDSQGMNIEHVWPQSFFAKRLPMKSDVHHLMATFIHPNSIRGSLPFGEVRGQGEYHNDGGAKAGQGVFEPPDAAKGRVARAMLYFFTRYYDRNITNGGFSGQFWNDKLELILRWNREFPPDKDESRRNDLVEQFQGNRNPFVDEPGIADRIGAEALKRVSRWDALNSGQ